MALAKLPPVDYQPWKPDPRTERAQARKKFGLSQPIPPSLLLQPYVPAPIAPGLPSLGPQQGLPGLTAPMPMSLPQLGASLPPGGMPLPGAGAPSGMPIPGMAEGGEFDVNPDEPYWGDMSEEERQQRLAEIAQAHQAAAAPAPPPGGLAPSIWQGMIQGAQNTIQTTQDWANAFKQQADERRQQVESQLGGQPQAPAAPPAPGLDMWQQMTGAANRLAQQGGQETPGVTAPGTLRGQLQEQHYNPEDPTAGNVAPDAASKLIGASLQAAPLIGFGPVESLASLGLQGATEKMDFGPVNDVAHLGIALAPYFGANVGELPTQTGRMGNYGATLTGGGPGGIGRAATELGATSGLINYAGAPIDTRLGLEQATPFGGPASLLAGAVGGVGAHLGDTAFDAVRARAAALGEARAPGERPGLFGRGAEELPGLRTEPVNQSLRREAVFGPNEVTATGAGSAPLRAQTLAPPESAARGGLAPISEPTTRLQSNLDALIEERRAGGRLLQIAPEEMPQLYKDSLGPGVKNTEYPGLSRLSFDDMRTGAQLGLNEGNWYVTFSKWLNELTGNRLPEGLLNFAVGSQQAEPSVNMVKAFNAMSAVNDLTQGGAQPLNFSDLVKQIGKGTANGMSGDQVQKIFDAYTTGSASTTSRGAAKTPTYNQDLMDAYHGRYSPNAVADTHHLAYFGIGQKMANGAYDIRGAARAPSPEAYDFVNRLTQHLAAEKGLSVDVIQAAMWDTMKKVKEAEGGQIAKDFNAGKISFKEAAERAQSYKSTGSFQESFQDPKVHAAYQRYVDSTHRYPPPEHNLEFSYNPKVTGSPSGNMVVNADVQAQQRASVVARSPAIRPEGGADWAALGLDATTGRFPDLDNARIPHEVTGGGLRLPGGNIDTADFVGALLSKRSEAAGQSAPGWVVEMPNSKAGMVDQLELDHPAGRVWTDAEIKAINSQSQAEHLAIWPRGDDPTTLQVFDSSGGVLQDWQLQATRAIRGAGYEPEQLRPGKMDAVFRNGALADATIEQHKANFDPRGELTGGTAAQPVGLEGNAPRPAGAGGYAGGGGQGPVPAGVPSVTPTGGTATFAATEGPAGPTTTTGPTQITPTGAGETVGPGGAARFETVTPEAEARARAENLTERNLAEKQARQEARPDLGLPGETLGQAAERLKTAGAPPAQASPGLENITLADLVGALQQRAQGASEGPVPAQGPYTPAETARAAQGEIRALQEAWTKYNGMPDGELIRQAEAAGVKPVGTAPLEGGRIPQAYRDQLTEKLTLDERTKATADLRPTELSVQDQMRGATLAGQDIQTNRMDKLFGPQANVDPRYNPELARHEAQVEEMAAREGVSKAAAEAKVSQQDWMKQTAQATPDAPHAPGTGFMATAPGRGLGALGRTLNEAGYFILGGDVGSVMRQDIGNIMNPMKAAETARIFGSTFRSFFSEKTADALMAKYQNELPNIQRLNTKIDYMDWKPGANMEGRESGISKLTSWIPGVSNFNRANAMWINSRRALTTESALAHNPNITPAQAQTMANMYRAFTGRGDFGPANAQMAKVGPLFTSLRFMASIPQRFAYLVPWQRMTDGKMEFMGPVWREAASAHAGWAAGTLLTMGMASAAGLQVGMDPRKSSSDDEGPGFGKIRTGRTDHDITGGAGRFLGNVVQLASGQKNWGLPGAKDYPRLFGETSPDLTAKMGKTVLGATPGRFGGTIADYLRNSMGPGANIALEVAKLTKLAPQAETSGKVLDFFHPDYWDKGPLGTGSLADRALGHVAFLWTQSTADALREDGLKGAFITAPLELFGSSATTIQPGAKSLRSDVLEDDARRSEALGPRLGQLTKGERYEDMSSYEKGLVNAKRDPAEVERMAQEARASGSVYQIKSDMDAAIEKQRRDHYDEMARDIKNGKGDASAMRQYMSALDKQTFDAKKNVTIEGGNGLPAPSSDIQKAVAAYQALYTSAQGADGKIDHARLEAAQKSFIDSVSRANPDLGERLALNVAQKVNTQDHPLAQEYDRMNLKGGPVDTYYSKVGPGNDYDPANAWRASHPQDDAKLAYYGFTHDVRSIEGYREFKKLTEGGSREPNLTLDMGKQGTSVRNSVPYAAREPIVEKYFSLPTAAERAVWQQEHPNADAVLWQWGYTSQLHSMRAYELTH